MDSNPARLIVRYGPSSPAEYPLTHDTTNIGREPFNDIVLNLPELSRRHARIIAQDGQYMLEDLNSTNGTTLNGRRVTDTEMLADGDEIDLGESVGFRFAAPVTPGAAATVVMAPPAASDQDTPRRPMTAVLPDFESEPVPPLAPPDLSYQYQQPQYTPPQIQEPLVPAAPEESSGGGCRRFVVGCFLVVVVLSVLVVGTLVVLDFVAPNLLYCGPMEPVVQFVADVLTLLGFGRIEPLACPIA